MRADTLARRRVDFPFRKVAIRADVRTKRQMDVDAAARAAPDSYASLATSGATTLRCGRRRFRVPRATRRESRCAWHCGRRARARRCSDLGRPGAERRRTIVTEAQLQPVERRLDEQRSQFHQNVGVQERVARCAAQQRRGAFADFEDDVADEAVGDDDVGVVVRRVLAPRRCR